METDDGYVKHHLAEPDIRPYCGGQIKDFGNSAWFDHEVGAVMIGGWCADCDEMSCTYFCPELPTDAVTVEAQEELLRNYIDAEDYAASGLKSIDLP